MRFAFSCQIILVLFILKINKIESYGKMYTSGKNEYFIMELQEYSWFGATIGCAKRNMTLATIETSEKSQEINSLVFGEFKEYKKLWVGGVRDDIDNLPFVWLPIVQRFVYTNWEGGKLILSLDQYCVGIGQNTEWIADNCLHKRGYICQRKN